MPGYDHTNKQRLVGYQLTEATYGYLMRALELGATEGELGDMRLSPQVAEIVQALHAVLAGGKVKVEIESQGHTDVFDDLNTRLEQGTRDANEINRKSGFYVTLTP
jgi:hypothetical protein